MKSLKTELEKVKDLLNQEEIIDNTENISFCTFNKIISENLSFLNKYTDEFKDNCLKKIYKDIKEYRGNIFSKNRKFMKNIKPVQLCLCINRNCGREWTTEIRMIFKDKKYSNAFDGSVTIKKNKEIEDIIIDIHDHNKKVSEEEKDEIINFISNRYYNDILNIISDLEYIIDLELLLSKYEQNGLKDTIYFYDSFSHDSKITSQKFKFDFLNIKYETNALGYNKINIEFSDENINEVFNKKLLKPIEIIDIINNSQDLILKRISVNINDLNEFYKRIITESKYYQNLCEVKKLEKK